MDETLIQEIERRGLMKGGDVDALEEMKKRGIHVTGQIGEMVGNRISKEIPDVDLATGIQKPGFRAGFSRMDTTSEKERFLLKNAGEGGFKRGKMGYMITPKGLKNLGIEDQRDDKIKNYPILIDEILPSWNDISDLAGIAPETLGAVGGGVAASGYGAIPGMLMSGMGALTGKLLDEGVEELQGLNDQSLGEVSMDALKTGGMAMGGEGVVRGMKPFGRFVLGPNTTQPRPAFGQKMAPVESTIDPKRLNLIDRIKSFGGKPSLGQATDKTLPRMGQQLAERIMGNTREPVNRAALMAEKARLSGTPSTVDAGALAARKIQGHMKDLQGRLNITQSNLDQTIERSVKSIQDSAGPSGGGSGEALRQAIKESKDEFSSAASELYGAVDKLSGRGKVVPTSKIKDQARKILEGFPETSGGDRAFAPSETKRFLETILQMERNITFKQAQNVRSTLSEAAYSPEMMKNVSTYQAGLLKKSVQESIDASFLGKSLEARKALNAANSFYAKNMKRFDDVIIAKITKDSHVRGSVQPEEVLNVLVGTKSPTRIKKIKALVKNPEVWQRVKREQWDHMLHEAQGIRGEIDAASLYRQVRKLGSGMGEFFEGEAKEIQRLAKALAAKEGKIHPNALEGGNIKQALLASLKAQEKSDTFMQTNFIKALQSGEREFADAVSFLSKAGRERHIVQARNFFGANSREWAAIKKEQLTNLLDNMISIGDDPVEKVISGKPLHEAVVKHKGVITEMHGAQKYKDILEFSQAAQLLTLEKGFTGGLIAANIALHPAANLPRLGVLAVMTRLLASDTALRFFTRGLKMKGLRQGSEFAIRAASQTMGQAINNVIQTFDPEQLGISMEGNIDAGGNQ